MDGATRLFWALTAALLSASAYFGVNAELHHRELYRRDAALTLSTGEEVSLGQVVDGDSLVVVTGAGENVSVRLVGIKAFDPVPGKGASARVGQDAADAVRKWFGDSDARVVLNATPKDSHGRFLVQLYLGEEDLGHRLVRSGLAMVYTAYDFPARQSYLAAQEAARSDEQGLWRDAQLAKRANRLHLQWQELTQ